MFSLVESSRGGDGETPSIGEGDDDTEQVPSGEGLAKHVIDRVISRRRCPLDQGPAKANLLDFLGFNAMFRDMVDAVTRPDDLSNPHSPILVQSSSCCNECAEHVKAK